MKGANFSHLPGLVTRQRRKLRKNLERFGPAVLTKCRRKNSTPRLFLHRSARSFRQRFAQSPEAALWSAAGVTLTTFLSFPIATFWGEVWFTLWRTLIGTMVERFFE